MQQDTLRTTAFSAQRSYCVHYLTALNFLENKQLHAVRNLCCPRFLLLLSQGNNARTSQLPLRRTSNCYLTISQSRYIGYLIITICFRYSNVPLMLPRAKLAT
jgi:hypothetical protein